MLLAAFVTANSGETSFLEADRTKETPRQNGPQPDASAPIEARSPLRKPGCNCCYSSLGNFGYLAPKAAFSQAKTAAIKALRLNENSAEATAFTGVCSLPLRLELAGGGERVQAPSH
jgi:hypothetical protein